MTPRNRSMARRAGTRAGLLAALTVAAAFTLATGDGPRIAFTAGLVEIGSGSPPVWRAAQVATPIAPGDAVRTGPDGRAEIVLGTGTVRIYADSMLTIPTLDSGPGAAERVRLERGRSLFDVLKRRDGRFEVETPEIVVSVKGTRFGVDLSDSLARVAVFRGLVGVRTASQTLALEMLVREGFAAVGGTDRPMELLLNGAADPWEGWSAGRLTPLVEDRAAALRSGAAAASAPRPTDPPAKLAVAQARAAARDASGPQVMELALRRDPELRERVAAEIRARRAAGDALAEVDPLPTRTEKTASADPDRDPVSDSRRLRRKIRASAIESVVTGIPAEPGGGSPSFQIDRVSGVAGGEQVIITVDGSTFSFDQQKVEQLIAGTLTLPAPMLDFLAARGVESGELDLVLQQLNLLLDD